MASSNSETIVRELLDLAGIEVNGSRPWDIQVHEPRLYDRVLQQATLGLGEAYMDGWWDCEAIDQFIDRALRANLEVADQTQLAHPAPRPALQAVQPAVPRDGL